MTTRSSIFHAERLKCGSAKTTSRQSGGCLRTTSVPTKRRLKQRLRQDAAEAFSEQACACEVKLTDQEIADLHNGLDVLRQVYAEPEFTKDVLDQYGPGTEGFDRTWQLYLKLEALRKK